MNQPAVSKTNLNSPLAGASLTAIPGGKQNRQLPLHQTLPINQLNVRWRLEKSSDSVAAQKNITDQEESIATKAINILVLTAIQQGASDVRLSFDNSGFNLQFSINGKWTQRSKIFSPPITADNYKKIVSRLKLLSGMDIAKKNIPQDGAAKIDILPPTPNSSQQGHHNSEPIAEFKLRAATNVDRKSSDLADSEAIVLRILSTARPKPLEELVPAHVLTKLNVAIANSTGLIIVCGPTGSGKTTTLYSMLGKLNDGTRNIVTVEDPVEYEFPSGVLQTQVNRQQGITFDTFTSNVLRLAPNVILVGETRTTETAKAAISVANTGHLVFTTVHADDSPAALSRMVDLGVEDYLVKDTVRAIVAQRLVPTLCSSCKVPSKITSSQLQKLNPEEVRDVHHDTYEQSAVGCECCGHTGIEGRTAVYEVLLMTDEVAKLIISTDNANKQLDISRIRAFVRDQGMSTLSQELALLVEGGTISYKDACRTAGIPEGRGFTDINEDEK